MTTKYFFGSKYYCILVHLFISTVHFTSFPIDLFLLFKITSVSRPIYITQDGFTMFDKDNFKPSVLLYGLISILLDMFDDVAC